MKQISILGCGWLGLPLAKSLIERGYSINGSTTTVAKMAVLENAGITSFHILISENKIEGNIDLFLKNSEILIIDIPPKLRGDSKENFIGKIQNLIPFLGISTVEKVIFVSSTAVYPDDNLIINDETKPTRVIDEQSEANPTTESGKQLLEVEHLLQAKTEFQTTIIRFGGLIGESRHPINFLSGRKNIENPDGPINLIHQEDCIGIIEKIIEKESWGEIFNAVGPHHPTRKEYYTQKAIERNLTLPEFDQSKTSVGKTISSEKLARVLGYKFQKPMN